MHLAGDPLELPQGPLGVPGPHFENQWSRRSRLLVLHIFCISILYNLAIEFSQMCCLLIMGYYYSTCNPPQKNNVFGTPKTPHFINPNLPIKTYCLTIKKKTFYP